jgi:hypothetical protein
MSNLVETDRALFIIIINSNLIIIIVLLISILRESINRRILNYCLFIWVPKSGNTTNNKTVYYINALQVTLKFLLDDSAY